MTSIRIYRTDKTLLVSYFDVIEQMSIFSEGKFYLSSETVKTPVYKTLKLNVHKGKLFISFAERNGDSEAVVHDFEPQHPGILLRFIHPKVKSTIEEFIDSNFEYRNINDLSIIEKEYVNELNFYDKTVKNEEKEDLAKLVVKMLAISFPVYIKFIDNRVTDGYYNNFSFNVKIKNYSRATNYRDFLISVFGVYRKDLAKVVLNCNTTTIDWVSHFKGLIPVDYIINGLRDALPMADGITGDFSTIQNFPPAVINRLFLDGMKRETDFITVQDALEMAGAIPMHELKLCRTWRELHDRGVMHYTHDTTGYKEISHPQFFEKFFENADFGSRKVIPLRNSEDFMKTGKYMDVCVGSLSYISRAFNGEGYCFRIDNADGQKYALVEVVCNDSDKWKIKQVKGNSNQSLPKEFHHELFNELNKYIPLESRK